MEEYCHPIINLESQKSLLNKKMCNLMFESPFETVRWRYDYGYDFHALKTRPIKDIRLANTQAFEGACHRIGYTQLFAQNTICSVACTPMFERYTNLRLHKFSSAAVEPREDTLS